MTNLNLTAESDGTVTGQTLKPRESYVTFDILTALNLARRYLDHDLDVDRAKLRKALEALGL
jgi:hypothetical protein